MMNGILERLPQVGEVVTIHALAFGGVKTTGRVLGAQDGGPILEQSPSGVTVARIETEDGLAEWIPWTEDVAQAVYYLHGDGAPEAAPEKPPVVAPPRADPANTHPDQEPRTRWRKTSRPWRDRAPKAEPEAAYEPLTPQLLAAEEAARLQRLGKAKAAPQAAKAAQIVTVPWEERAAEACGVQERRVRAAARAVKEAQASLRKAERAYYQEAPSDDEEAQEGLFDEEVGLSPDATKERDLRALTGAQEAYRHARDHLAQVEQAAPLAILREVTAAWRPPAWAWALLGVGAVALAGNFILLGLLVFVGLPVFAFIGALRL